MPSERNSRKTSFRDRSVAKEPGIHIPEDCVHGFRVRRCAAPRNDNQLFQKLKLASAIVCALLETPAAHAHGFGQRYDLPLPLSLYLVGTAAAVVLSFVVIGIVARHAPAGRTYPRLDLRTTRLGHLLAHPLLLVPLQVTAVALFLLAITAGLFGNQDPYRNIAPTLVWIIWWVGLALFSAFLGDIWKLINPWATLFDAAERACSALRFGPALMPALAYPARLGAWPAVILLLAVAWTELVFPSPAVPSNIAAFAIAYSLLTWAGMLLFGSAVWLERGEVFSVFFSLLARFAPTEIIPGKCGARGGLALRPFGAGLLPNEPAPPSMIAFVLLVLASVLYDGLLTTPEWSGAERALVGLLPASGTFAIVLVRSLGLAAFWGVFLAAYLATSTVMSRVAGALSPMQVAQGFAFTLVPIALAYHLAHYLVYLLTQGQYLVPLLSDPFGWGWNLFGTAGYRVNIAIVGARFAWYAAVVAIVTGHIAAVFLADVRAHQLLPQRRRALLSQVPLTALMVIYTFVSLSILAEPIVERRTPAQPVAAAAEPAAIPADAVLPEPGTGQLLPVGAGHSARLALTYRMLGSAFHDGSRMTEADLLYAYMFAYRWGAPGAAPAHYDATIDTATAALRQHLLGVRFAGVDTASKSFRVGDVEFTRELFIIEIYADLPPGDAEQDAVYAPPWSTLPWHLIALMEAAVERGWAAFSREEAVRRNVDWLDLVRSEELKTRLAGLVDEFTRQGYRPPILEPLVGAADARQRWAALAAFYRSHGHFLVTNGPYRLKQWSNDSATLEAFRDLSYPLGVGSYDTYAVPRRGYVTNTERTSGGLRLTADIETVMKFMRDYRIERHHMRELDTTILKRAAPECRYVVLDDEGRVTLAATAMPDADATFQIELDRKLPPGRYTVSAEIIVNGNAMNAAIERIPVVVGE